MKERLVVVSNRVAGDRPPAGGLVFALHDCLTANGGVWIGSAADIVAQPSDRLTRSRAEGYDRYLFDLTEDDHDRFYLGYSNSVLWPLCHGRTDLMDQRADYFQGYVDVNARMALQMQDVLKNDDLIWIHDYHFLPLARELRKLGVANRIGFFLHIPFPAGHDLLALSHAAELVDWIGAYDLVGVQSERDVAQMLQGVRDYDSAEILRTGQVRIGERIVNIRSFPIGIDVDSFRADISEAAEDQVHLGRGEHLVFGVDRLDYSKGLPQRFDGFRHFLERRGAVDPKATFLQVAPISRGEVAAYQDIRATLEQKAGAINGAYGTPDWMPIRYISQSMDRAAVAQTMRQASVGLVTPLIDGMNLVAKEFVAAQDPDDPGVLVLSKLAGAAEQMDAALLVNPYDPSQIGDAVSTALNMPLADRQARHKALLEGIEDQDIYWWTRTFLDHLRTSHHVADVRMSA